jgi:hypothetical protein
MLCKMEEGTDYAEVLKEAQDLGYAEVRLSHHHLANVGYTWYTYGVHSSHLAFIHYHDIFTGRSDCRCRGP